MVYRHSYNQNMLERTIDCLHANTNYRLNEIESRGDTAMDQAELLMKEYEACATMIVHWDEFFYETSRFYLFIESALLAVAFSLLTAQLVDEKPMRPELITLFVCLTLFNLVLCYIWFRANRSNREYLRVGFIRALEIENDPAFPVCISDSNWRDQTNGYF
jgi:hypothetical protein